VEQLDFGEEDRYMRLDDKKDPLVKLNAIIPWELFRPRLRSVWREPERERRRDPRRRSSAVRDSDPTLSKAAINALPVGGFSGRDHVFVEVLFGMAEVEGTGALDVVGAEVPGGPGQTAQLGSAGGLGSHGYRGPSLHRLDHRFGHDHPLLKGHGGEIAGGTPSQEDGVAALEASPQQETHVPPDSFQVQRQLGVVVKQCGDGDVATGQASSGLIEIHG